MTIQEKNEKIAKFMGYIYHEKVDIDTSDCGGLYERMDVYSKIPILMESYPEDDQFYLKDEYNPKIGDVIYGNLTYDEDWNLLMDVVEKIESLGAIVEIWLSLGKGCRIQMVNPSINFTHESNSTIEAVYEAVYKFIEWYENK